MRQDQWKALKYNVDHDPPGPVELYDLSADPGETEDLAGKYPDMVRQMEMLMDSVHVLSDVFPFRAEEVLLREGIAQ